MTFGPPYFWLMTRSKKSATWWGGTALVAQRLAGRQHVLDARQRFRPPGQLPEALALKLQKAVLVDRFRDVRFAARQHFGERTGHDLVVGGRLAKRRTR